MGENQLARMVVGVARSCIITTMGMKTLVIGGDGIGPEVIDASMPLLHAVAAAAGVELDVEHHFGGGALYDREARFMNDELKRAAEQADIILFGAEGGPQWDDLPRVGPPEEHSTLTWLRVKLDLYFNIRPVKPLAALKTHSSLKPKIVEGIDLVVVRELCGGIYFGQPRGRDLTADGQRRGFETQSYTESEISRIARDAFSLARTRDNRVASVDKANVMESGVLWRDVVSEVGAAEFADVELSHLYCDNALFQLGMDPTRFDVILSDNLFGDLLSDAAAVGTGSLGMLPSAALGPVRASGARQALYEPVHGTAPDIAGRGVANPIATILSIAMMAELSFHRPDIAARVYDAVERTVAKGLYTPDLGGTASTKALAAAVLSAF